MSDWLLDRLTPAKSKEARWTELALLMQNIWEQSFDPEYSRVERLRSFYQADDADLCAKIREMGDYFSFDLPTQEDKPVAVAWRRLELEYKDMELILNSVFRRHFGHFPVEWYPLFAPVDLPYGTEFDTSDYLLEESWTKNHPPEKHFLTSRGVVGVDKMGLFRDRLDKETFRTRARPLVVRTKPLHIVFDGFLWFIRYDLGTFDPFLDTRWDSEDHFELQFGPLCAFYDYILADARRVDIDIFLTRSETDRRVSIIWPEIPWRLDKFLPDGFGDTLPLDLMYPAQKELSRLAPINIIYHEIDKRQHLPVPYPFQINCNRARASDKIFAMPRLSICQYNESFGAAPEISGFTEAQPALDRLPSFDEIGPDFAPLDYPYGRFL